MRWLLVLFTLFSLNVSAVDIAFGTIKGIKLYDFANSKSIKVYFDSDSIISNKSCMAESGLIIGTIENNKHEPKTIDRMLSLLLMAQASKQKVRVYSNGNGCEIDFVAIQDTYF
ncbi:hypothetical protein SOPP22_01475 [Shewanella sp. OPT22]|nr:hypothetical protein SOPP22_01475 [Shewanella sp. OPT22]